jgi:formylmethanofuran dehydrogenase subunit C
VRDYVALTLRAAPPDRLEVEGLTADRCAELSAHEIAHLSVWTGARRASVGDFFDVRGERASCLRVEGSLARVDGLAAGNAGGEVIIDGDAGARVGASMTGGRVEVRGAVGHEAGLAMGGGVLRVHGDAGDRLGSATAGASKGMTGGEIVVAGAAGADAAVHMRRGLVVIGGHAGENVGRAMIAGSVIVLGRVGAAAGRGNRRGSIIAVGTIEVPQTYRYACTFEPPHVRLTMTYLRRRYGLVIDDAVVSGRYRRYCGDAGEPGKGEILAYCSMSP